MKLQAQIKKYRTLMNLSQEQLAEKIYVTRQSISNWENGKNCPDIHSLLLLSALFNVSLDELIKGDIQTMKTEIEKSQIVKLNRYSIIYTILLTAVMLSIIPIILLDNIYIIISAVVLYGITIYFSLKIEQFKKNNDIYTYQEITAFMEGKRLDQIQQQQEIGKRPYQQFLLACGCAIIVFIIGFITMWLFKR